MAASVLVSEALVILFAVLVAKDLSDVDGSTVWAVGGAASVACLLLAGLLRYRVAYVAGSVLQVFVVASGAVVPVMFFLGLAFAALWFLALTLGLRVQRLQAAAQAQAQAPTSDPAPPDPAPPDHGPERRS